MTTIRDNSVLLVEQTPGGWSVQTAAVADPGHYIHYAAPGVMPDGQVKVLYSHKQFLSASDTWVGELRMASRQASAWSDQQLKGSITYGLSTGTDPQGRIWVAYDVPAGGHWSYMNTQVGCWDGTTYTDQTVGPSLSYGGRPVLATDATGRPHVAYETYTDASSRMYNPYIGVAELQDNGTWLTDLGVRTNTPNYYDLGFALDFEGDPHVCFGNDTAGGLWHGSKDGGQWYRELVSGGRDGRASAIAVDNTGHVAIAFSDYLTDDMWYAYETDNGWQLEPIDGTGQVQPIAIWFDKFNHAQIVYEELKASMGMGLRIAYQVPEPASLGLLASGGLVLLRRRPQRHAPGSVGR